MLPLLRIVRYKGEKKVKELTVRLKDNIFSFLFPKGVIISREENEYLNIIGLINS